MPNGTSPVAADQSCLVVIVLVVWLLNVSGLGEVGVIFQKECGQDWNQQEPHETSREYCSPIGQHLSILSDDITVIEQESLYLKLLGRTTGARTACIDRKRWVGRDYHEGRDGAAQQEISCANGQSTRATETNLEPADGLISSAARAQYRLHIQARLPSA